MKRRSTDWKKVLANFISDKRLISKTYNTIKLSNKNKQTDWLNNGQKIWIDFFVKEDLQMANTRKEAQHHESSGKCKTTIMYHLTLWECLSSKRQEMTNVGEDAEKGNLHELLVKSKPVQPPWKTICRFPKN